MSKQILFLLCCFATLLITTSCSPEYRPNVVNAPLMQSRGEAKGGVYLGTNGYDLQGAYAFHDHFAVMVNTTYFSGKSGSSSISGNTIEYFNRHFFAEAAPGYFTAFGNHGSFEVYSGYGAGLSNNWNTNAPTVVNSNYHRIFIQPNIGLTTDYFDLAVSARSTFVGTKTPSNPLSERKFSPLIEPAITIRAGYQLIKGSFQTGLVIPLSEVNFDTNPFMVSFGLYITLPTGGE